MLAKIALDVLCVFLVLLVGSISVMFICTAICAVRDTISKE